MKKYYLILEHWSDGTITEYVSKQLSAEDALWWARDRYKSIKHVLDLDGPERFECVNFNASDNKRYWHPAISMSSLIENVYMLSELEAYSTHTTKRVMLDKVAKSNYN